MKPTAFDYLACTSAADAVARLCASDGMARLCSGTQSLGPMLNLRLAQPAQLLDLSRAPELLEIRIVGGRLLLGAALTHARIEDGAAALAGGQRIGQWLATLASGIAYRAVRNRGTLGGSLAHADPAADWVNVACLLDAGIHVLGTAGPRRIAASDFFVGAFTTSLAEDEVITAVDWPLIDASAKLSYRKMCRKPGEFAEALAAIWIDETAQIARLVIGALDGSPRIVTGSTPVGALRSPTARAALLDDIGLDDPYRRQLQSAMIRRAFADIDHPASDESKR